MVEGIWLSLHNQMNQWRWKNRKRIQESEPHLLSSVGTSPLYQRGKHLSMFYRIQIQFTLDCRSTHLHQVHQASGVVGSYHISSTQARSPPLTIDGCMKSLLDKSCGVTCMNWRVRDWFFSKKI